jgi:hypothetical protein
MAAWFTALPGKMVYSYWQILSQAYVVKGLK